MIKTDAEEVVQEVVIVGDEEAEVEVETDLIKEALNHTDLRGIAKCQKYNNNNNL